MDMSVCTHVGSPELGFALSSVRRHTSCSNKNLTFQLMVGVFVATTTISGPDFIVEVPLMYLTTDQVFHPSMIEIPAG